MNVLPMVFVTGLHRSGTSLLHRILRDHPDISGFRNTGVSEDEGQHLQTVLPRAGAFGGPGQCARNPAAHMTETNPLATEKNAEALFAQWAPYWDLGKRYLVEKSPVTLTRTRLHQALFPSARFVVILRHPIAVALATYNALASGGSIPEPSLEDLIENWVVGYETYREDAAYLRQLVEVRYEELAVRPQQVVEALYKWLGLETAPLTETIDPYVDQCYLEQWAAMSTDPGHEGDIRRALRFEERARSFGYSLLDVPSHGDRDTTVLETDRLVLREVQYSDVDAIASLCGDEEVMRYFGGAMPREQVWGEIMAYREEYRHKGYSFWAVRSKADGRLIGQCGLRCRDVDGKQETEVGYMFARPYWGQGLATEAARAVLDYALGPLGLARVLALVDLGNERSLRLVERLGMQVAGKTEDHGREHAVFSAER